MWYILYVSSVHRGPVRMQDGMAFGSFLLFVTRRNFLVERLGGGLIPKSNSYIHACECFYFDTRPSYHLCLLYAVGARVWLAARLGRSLIAGDCGAGANRAWQGVESSTRLPRWGGNGSPPGSIGRTLGVEMFSRAPRVDGQDDFFIHFVYLTQNDHIVDYRLL